MQHDRVNPPWFLAAGDFVYRHGQPPIFVKADGCTLIDSDGKRYLSAEAANGTAALGFDSSILNEAVSRVSSLAGLPSFCESRIRLSVAQRIAEHLARATGQNGRVAFQLGGAQAIELALLIARHNATRGQIVCFEGGYHGRSPFTSHLSASHRYRRTSADWRLPVIRLPYPDCDQCRFSQQRMTCHHECVSFVRNLVESEVAGVVGEGAEDVAVVLVEAVLNAGGIVQPDVEYMRSVIETFRARGALIVFDETFCGFHRTGPMFGFEHYGCIPDIVVLGKALTNGISPLSCVWAREPLAAPDRFPPGSHSATFVNNALSMAIADTVLSRFQCVNNWSSRVLNIEEMLARMFERLAARHAAVKSTFVVGAAGRLLLRAPLAPTILSRARSTASLNGDEGFEGAILASTGMTPNIVAVNPALTITATELLHLERILDGALHTVDDPSYSQRLDPRR